jgi:lysophospholipase L1-like esterase
MNRPRQKNENRAGSRLTGRLVRKAAVTGLSCLLLTALCAPERVLGQEKVTRIACLGDSITLGQGTKNPAADSYPAQLQQMLGNGYLVGNFGVSARTLICLGDYQYQKSNGLKDALKFDADIVTIMLGSNDSKPGNWAHKERFVGDYEALIQTLRALPTKPKIYLCYPPFVPGTGNYGINEPVIEEQMSMIDQIARDEGLAVIDTHAALKGHEGCQPDKVHTNREGGTLLAKSVYKALTGREFTGELPADKKATGE